MARITKVVVDGVLVRNVAGHNEVTVHVQDGEIEREITLGGDAREQIHYNGVEVEDSNAEYSELFGNEEGSFIECDDEDDDEDDELCDDCGEYDHDCTCFGDEEEDDEPWEDDDVVALAADFVPSTDLDETIQF